METDPGPEIDPREFRNTLGRFASGVTVVTTRLGDNIHGMTVSAFMSVSLDPPLVGISVDNSASMNALLPQTSRYGVSILARGQDTLSQHFAGQPQEGLESPFGEENGIPLIRGALAHLACRVVDTCPGGDHTIYIGRVEYLSYRQGVEPLLYFTGGYRSLAPLPDA